jgi:hypothetical protein
MINLASILAIYGAYRVFNKQKYGWIILVAGVAWYLLPNED